MTTRVSENFIVIKIMLVAIRIVFPYLNRMSLEPTENCKHHMLIWCSTVHIKVYKGIVDFV